MVNFFEYGGIRSSDFDIYISGENLFNSPQRDVELIEIPGRNGSYALDHGRFKNVRVTYRVFNQETSLADFRTKLEALRGALCSLRGYQRLTDTINYTEYRMATLVDAIEIKPVGLATASQFEIIFDCKPQRYLLSGDRPVPITAQGIWTLNDTHYPAHPLLEVEGYGDITIDGRKISINSAPLGRILVANWQKKTLTGNNVTYQYFANDTRLNTGDTLSFAGYNEGITVIMPGTVNSVSNYTTVTGTAFQSASAFFNTVKVFFNPSFTATYGTASSNAASVSINYTADGSSKNATLTVNCYIGASGTVTVSASITKDCNGYWIDTPAIYGDSTKTALGEPLYIDCDLGEAYKIEDGQTVSVNAGVTLGAELPVLEPGDRNRITYDDTITDLKITPRLWTV